MEIWVSALGMCSTWSWLGLLTLRIYVGMGLLQSVDGTGLDVAVSTHAPLLDRGVSVGIGHHFLEGLTMRTIWEWLEDEGACLFCELYVMGRAAVYVLWEIVSVLRDL
jgi:hypothetical protein